VYQTAADMVAVARSDLGIFELDQRTDRSERRASIEAQLTELEKLTGRLEAQFNAWAKERTVWETIREAAEEYQRSCEPAKEPRKPLKLG
jgi:hypothetical protein